MLNFQPQPISRVGQENPTSIKGGDEECKTRPSARPVAMPTNVVPYSCPVKDLKSYLCTFFRLLQWYLSQASNKQRYLLVLFINFIFIVASG